MYLVNVLDDVAGKKELGLLASMALLCLSMFPLDFSPTRIIQAWNNLQSDLRVAHLSPGNILVRTQL